jgi:dTDP-glucose 4,6-dehydratase/UDP-glucose 4,6-dehydratase
MYYCASELNIPKNIRNDKRYIFIKGNICNKDFVTHILNSFEITHVIHFAAQSHVQNSFEDALQYTQDNIVGTHTLLESCRLFKKIKKFIHISTDEVYGESMLGTNENKKTEQSILCPTNPYAATKASAELIAQSYYHSFSFPLIVVRCNNVYGYNQYPEKLIPKFILLLKKNEKVTIQGDGSCVRSFIYIDDVTDALHIIMKNGLIGEIYNIGSDDNEYSVLDVARKLIKFLKNTEEYNKWITYIEDRPFNDKRYYICNKKLRNLGWKQKTNFTDGIKKIIEYENKNKK